MYYTSYDLEKLILNEYPFVKKIKITKINEFKETTIDIKVLLKNINIETYFISKKELSKSIKYLVECNSLKNEKINVSVFRWKISKRRMKLLAA